MLNASPAVGLRSVPESDPREEARIGKVAMGIYRIMRATSDEKEVPRSPAELDDEDKAAIRDIARGVINIWDGLTVGAEVQNPGSGTRGQHDTTEDQRPAQASADQGEQRA